MHKPPAPIRLPRLADFHSACHRLNCERSGRLSKAATAMREAQVVQKRTGYFGAKKPRIQLLLHAAPCYSCTLICTTFKGYWVRVLMKDSNRLSGLLRSLLMPAKSSLALAPWMTRTCRLTGTCASCNIKPSRSEKAVIGLVPVLCRSLESLTLDQVDRRDEEAHMRFQA